MTYAYSYELNQLGGSMGLDEERYFDFVYDRFKTAEAATDSIYTVCGITLTVVAAVGAGIYAISDTGLILGPFAGFAIPIYKVSLMLAVVLWTRSGFLLAGALFPRTEYPNLKRTAVWEQKLAQLRSADAQTAHKQLADELLARMHEAEDAVRTINEARRVSHKKAMVASALSMLFLAIAAAGRLFA